MGTRPRHEVADIVRSYGDELGRTRGQSVTEQKVLRHIATCRSAALGGHVDECDACGHVRPSYNSCRDRHCPKCQAKERARWLEQRLQRLLPVPYFHVVFTLPDTLNAIALGNRRAVYSVLFKAASKTLLELSRDSKYLGADIGITAVLHTWGQNLLFHPHLHCVVTGGGLACDGSRWVPAREKHLLPVGVLGALFRGKFLGLLEDARKAGDLRFGGSTAELADPIAWAGLRDRLYRARWIVYAKAPFGGPEHVFRYLGRYTHCVAISNHRLVSIGDGRVTFRYKDYRDDHRTKLMTLQATEFLRRFLLHILPPRFVRIRHYGLHAPANVNSKLPAARRHLRPDQAPEPAPEDDQPLKTWWERFCERTGVDVMACPVCGGRLQRGPSILRAVSPRAPPEAA